MIRSKEEVDNYAQRFKDPQDKKKKRKSNNLAKSTKYVTYTLFIQLNKSNDSLGDLECQSIKILRAALRSVA